MRNFIFPGQSILSLQSCVPPVSWISFVLALQGQQHSSSFTLTTIFIHPYHHLGLRETGCQCETQRYMMFIFMLNFLPFTTKKHIQFQKLDHKLIKFSFKFTS